MSSLRFFVLSAGLMLASTPLWAGDLDEMLARDALSAQKLLSDANYALKESLNFEASSPGQAALLL